MCKQLAIDFVAAPFAGHLYPQLQLACGLRDRGFENIRFLNTPESRTAVELSGFELTPLLNDVSASVFAIANTDKRVGSHPVRLLKQLRENLSLMDQLQSELRSHWQQHRPDLVIADLTVPVAGLLAQSMGIEWWSSMPTICVIDTKDGTPAYMGGWNARAGVMGKVRDASGRRLTRLFKKSVHRIFRRRMQLLGIDQIYRDDGYETIYSPDTILGFGIREFEFDRTWPPALQFVGPMTDSPRVDHTPPEFVNDKPHVLVSLGTHLNWAKQDAQKLIREVARLMPDYVFHFTSGKPFVQEKQVDENFHVYGYFPYDQYASRYALAIHHGGTGVMYACLQNGIAALVWPQDYDQFDHAARLVHHGLAKRCRPRADRIANDLQELMTDAQMRANVQRFRQIIDSYQTADMVAERLSERCSAGVADEIQVN